VIAVRAITTRLRRLEQRFAPEPDLKVWETAMVLFERRRRRVESARQPFEELPPARPERGTDIYRLLRRCAWRGRSAYEPSRDSYRY
jgi:hypothetical protein